MLSVAKNGKQHVASCKSNQVLEPHMGPTHQRTNPYLLLASLQQRTEYQPLLQQPELSGAKGVHTAKATSHMVTTTVTSPKHSTNYQREGFHRASSPPSNGSSNDHQALIQALTPLLKRGGQFSVN